MGGAVNVGGALIAGAANVAGQNKTQREYYRALAQTADKQAALQQAAAKRQAEYIFRSAAQESTRLQDEYTAALDAQQSARAANGLANSYTVQQIMQDSRWNLLTDQQTLRQNTADQLYETNLSALLGVQAKRDEASQYRTLSRRTSGSFLTQYLQRLFNGFSN